MLGRVLLGTTTILHLSGNLYGQWRVYTSFDLIIGSKMDTFGRENTKHCPPEEVAEMYAKKLKEAKVDEYRILKEELPENLSHHARDYERFERKFHELMK